MFYYQFLLMLLENILLVVIQKKSLITWYKKSVDSNMGIQKLSQIISLLMSIAFY